MPKKLSKMVCKDHNQSIKFIYTLPKTDCSIQLYCQSCMDKIQNEDIIKNLIKFNELKYGYKKYTQMRKASYESIQEIELSLTKEIQQTKDIINKKLDKVQNLISTIFSDNLNSNQTFEENLHQFEKKYSVLSKNDMNDKELIDLAKTYEQLKISSLKYNQLPIIFFNDISKLLIKLHDQALEIFQNIELQDYTSKEFDILKGSGKKGEIMRNLGQEVPLQTRTYFQIASQQQGSVYESIMSLNSQDNLLQVGQHKLQILVQNKFQENTYKIKYQIQNLSQKYQYSKVDYVKEQGLVFCCSQKELEIFKQHKNSFKRILILPTENSLRLNSYLLFPAQELVILLYNQEIVGYNYIKQKRCFRLAFSDELLEILYLDKQDKIIVEGYSKLYVLKLSVNNSLKLEKEINVKSKCDSNLIWNSDQTILAGLRTIYSQFVLKEKIQFVNIITGEVIVDDTYLRSDTIYYEQNNSKIYYRGAYSSINSLCLRS